LTIHLREHGNQKAYLCTGGSQLAATESEAIAKARAWVGLDGQDYAAKVTRENVEVWKCENVKVCKCENVQMCKCENVEATDVPHIVCYDFGVKTNIIRSIAAWANVTVVPAKTSAEEVLAFNPDGIFLSNGPADPAAVTYAIKNIRKLLGMKPLVTGLTGFTGFDSYDFSTLG
jgi:carbamoyl-phosphate synthase small subunit